MISKTTELIKSKAAAHPRIAYGLAGLFGVAALVSTPYAYHGLDAQAPEKDFEADAVIVFAGGHGRVARGVEMWLQDGEGTLRVFISGAKEEQNLDAVIGMTYPKILSHPDIHEIELGDRALDTVGNAMESAEWLQQNPALRNVIVVTSDYHQARANLQLKRWLPDDVEVRFEGIDNGMNLQARRSEVLKTFASSLGFNGNRSHLRIDDESNAAPTTPDDYLAP